MPINDLFKARKARDLQTIAAQIDKAIERVRSHALGFSSCGCSTGALSAVGFSEFETSLVHHVAMTYPELSVHSSRTIEDVVNSTFSFPIEEAEPILTAILTALTSYGEQCRAFRADEQD